MTSQKMAEKTAPGVSPSNKATMKMKKLSEATSRTLEADQVSSTRGALNDGKTVSIW